MTRPRSSRSERSASGSPPARPRVRPGVQIRDLPDGCAVLDLESEAIHMLNPTAAFILTMCDGSRSPDELAGELRAAAPSLSAERASADIGTALRELASKGIIEDAAETEHRTRR